MDGTAPRRTGADLPDEFRHLAKVRVAGSNPVFRSRLDVAGQGWFLTPSRPLPKTHGQLLIVGLCPGMASSGTSSCDRSHVTYIGPATSAQDVDLRQSLADLRVLATKLL